MLIPSSRTSAVIRVNAEGVLDFGKAYVSGELFCMALVLVRVYMSLQIDHVLERHGADKIEVTCAVGQQKSQASFPIHFLSGHVKSPTGSDLLRP